MRLKPLAKYAIYVTFAEFKKSVFYFNYFKIKED